LDQTSIASAATKQEIKALEMRIPGEVARESAMMPPSIPI
jgi:hypothetical protein